MVKEVAIDVSIYKRNVMVTMLEKWKRIHREKKKKKKRRLRMVRKGNNRTTH